MKRIIKNILGSTSFVSMPDGNTRAYPTEETMAEVLGQADKLRFHAHVFEKTDTNARASLRLFESSVDGPVDKLGAQIGSTFDLSATGATFAMVNGPFCGRVTAILEVYDSTTTAQKRFQMALGVTLFMGA